MPLSKDEMRLYMKRRYHERRALALRFLGGKCSACASKRDLQVDHVDPKRKTMNFTGMRSVGMPRFMAELKGCQLLCKPCHERKTRVDMNYPPTGQHGVSMYRHGKCRCDVCREANRASQRTWREKKKNAHQANAE